MSQKAKLKALRAANRRRQNYLIVGIIALCAFLITGALILPSMQKNTVEINPRPMADKNSMGDQNAKVKVEEFSDFQCPYCGQFALKQEAKYVEKYVKTGKVYLTFVPFSFIGEESVKAAEAAYCAADQGQFWEYHDQIFSNQNGENQGAFTRDVFITLANNLSLDMTTFEDCIDKETYRERVMDDITYAQSKGVNGTPYFMVNDKLVDSSELEAAIEEALQAN